MPNTPQTASPLTLRNARLESGADPVDIVIENGVVAGIAAAGGPVTGESLDLDGRSVIPGLWDQHVHFRQWTAMQRRLDLSGATSAAHAIAIVRDAVAAASGAPVRIEGSGFRDGLWPDVPTIAALDAAVGDTVVILVSGDLHCAWLSSAAIASLGATRPAGELFREFEWFDLSARVQAGATPLGVADFAAAADAAAARGIVGVTELDKDDNLGDWSALVQAGVRSLRVRAAVWPHRMEAAIGRGLRTGDAIDGTDGLVTMGPLKVVVDGSLNTRTAYCHAPYPGLDPADAASHGILSFGYDELEGLLRRANDNGIAAAIHAIGDHANGLVLDAFEAIGMRGTIEHAQLVDEEDFARFARLGITASVQPEHAMDDRDVADKHWAGRTARAFAFGSLLRAGVELSLGSDAPVAPLDPWHAISAAVSRSRGGREPWHPEQAISTDEAIAASTGGLGATVRTGAVADLVVLDADPAALTSDELREMPVAATLRAGEFTWRASTL